MGVSLNAVKDAALSLDLDARAKLVESLILSIDLPSEPFFYAILFKILGANYPLST